MWCKSCRQDVPGIVAPQGRGFCCARCGELVYEGAASQQPTDGSEDLAADAVVPDYWAWQVNQQLRHAEKVVARGRRRQLSTGEQIRIDNAWAPKPAAEPRHEVPPKSHPPADQETPLTAFAWLTICAGVTALTCGTALMIWSVYADRTELWNTGLPIMIAGQVALVLGMGLQLAARTRFEHEEVPQQTRGGSRTSSRETNRSIDQS